MTHLVDLSSKVDSDEVFPALLLCLLHHIVTDYPSQLSYRRFYDTLPLSVASQHEKSIDWVKSLSASLRCYNYTKIEQLSRPTNVAQLFQSAPELARKALHITINKLRENVRNTAWRVIRSAYREIACQPDCQETRVWLQRSLLLDENRLDKWLDEQSALGHVRPKENIPGRWILSRVR